MKSKRKGAAMALIITLPLVALIIVAVLKGCHDVRESSVYEVMAREYGIEISENVWEIARKRGPLWRVAVFQVPEDEVQEVQQQIARHDLWNEFLDISPGEISPGYFLSIRSIMEEGGLSMPGRGQVAYTYPNPQDLSDFSFVLFDDERGQLFVGEYIN